MSNYPPPGMPQTAYPQAAYPPPPQPSGCGCGGCLGKFFILLGVGFFLMIVVCCGGFFYLGSLLQHSITQQPNDVREIREEVAALDVPAPLAPVGAGRIKMPFTGTLIGEGAAFADKDRTSFLFVGSFGTVFGVNFKDQLLKAVESGQFQNKPANAKDDERSEDLKDVNKSQIDRTIRGEKAVFQITEGTGVKSGKKKIRVQGAFEGKIGPSLLVIDAEEATLSREKVDKIIQSIDAGGAGDKK
jgi:hypothetical protein